MERIVLGTNIPAFYYYYYYYYMRRLYSRQFNLTFEVTAHVADAGHRTPSLYKF